MTFPAKLCPHDDRMRGETVTLLTHFTGADVTTEVTQPSGAHTTWILAEVDPSHQSISSKASTLRHRVTRPGPGSTLNSLGTLASL